MFSPFAMNRLDKDSIPGDVCKAPHCDSHPVEDPQRNSCTKPSTANYPPAVFPVSTMEGPSPLDTNHNSNNNQNQAIIGSGQQGDANVDQLHREGEKQSVDSAAAAAAIRRSSIVSNNDSVCSSSSAQRRPVSSSTLNRMKVYIRHIGSKTTAADVQRFAELYGSVARIELSRERGGTSHCCYVTYDMPMAAQRCVRGGNGTPFFSRLSVERGEGPLPPCTARMAESMEERRDRLAAKANGQAPAPPPPPYQATQSTPAPPMASGLPPVPAGYPPHGSVRPPQTAQLAQPMMNVPVTAPQFSVPMLTMPSAGVLPPNAMVPNNGGGMVPVPVHSLSPQQQQVVYVVMQPQAAMPVRR